MQAYFRIVALATLAAVAVPALATSQRVEIVAPAFAAQAVLAIVDQDQHFQLDNGRRVVVNASGDSLQMNYRNRRALMKHDGQGSFTTSDGRISLRFAMDAAGQPDLIALSAPANWF